MKRKAPRKWQGMNWIRREKRVAIYLRDGCACAYCGATLEDGTQLTLDYLRPRRKNQRKREFNCGNEEGGEMQRILQSVLIPETERPYAGARIQGIRDMWMDGIQMRDILAYMGYAATREEDVIVGTRVLADIGCGYSD